MFATKATTTTDSTYFFKNGTVLNSPWTFEHGLFLFLLVLCLGSWVAKSVGGGFINHGHAGHTHCCRPFHMRKRKRNIIRSLFTIPLFIGRILSRRQFKHTLFFTQTGRGRKKRRKGNFLFNFLPRSLLFSFFQGRLLRNFLSFSLFLSLPSISRWRSQLTCRRRREKRRKKNSGGGGGVEMDFFSFLSLRTRDGRESARGSADRALPPSKDSFTLNTFDSPFKSDPNWKPFLPYPYPYFAWPELWKQK